MPATVSARGATRAAGALLIGAFAAVLSAAVLAAPFAYVPRGSGNTAAVVDLETRSIVANPVIGSGPYSVAASRATGKIFFGLQLGSNTVVRVDAATHTVDRTYSMGGRVNGVAVTPDGSRFYAPMMDNPLVKAVDVATGTVLASIPVGAMAHGIAVSPDGSKVLVVNTNSHNISVIDTASHTVVHTIGSRNNPQTVAFSPDGSRAYVTLWSADQLQVIDMATYTDGHVQVGGRPIGVAVSPDGTRIYTANSSAGTVSVIDGTTNAWITNIGVGAGTTPVGVSTTVDGTAVYVTRLGSNDVVRIDTATNSVTDTIPIGSAPYAMGIFTTGLTVPAPPVIASVTADIGQATVNFTPSVNNGGKPITNYRVSCDSFSADTLTSPVLFTGMTNGSSYACRAFATNELGDSVFSNTINVTPGRVPTAPMITATIPGNQQVTVHFDPPSSNGGVPISSYRLYCTGPGGTHSTPGVASPITVTGLVNGTSYLCVMRAFNSIGQGALTDQVKAVPRTVPDAPMILAAVAENQAAFLQFETPASNGAAIASYIGRCDGGFEATVDATQNGVRITGLSNGQTYSCRVHAVNVAGESPPSTSHDIVPAGAPDAPTLISVQEGDGQLSLQLQAPAFDGGAAITGYSGSCGSIVGSSLVSPVVVDGLSNGTSYSCSVRAHNVMGAGPASDPLSGTPRTVPDAPVIGAATPGDQQASIAFSSPAFDGGAAISAYILSCTPGVPEIVGAISPQTVAGLSNGIVYGCSVRARNVAGDGAASAEVSVIPGNTGSSANLAISKTNSVSFVNGGARTGYLITVSNPGPAAVAGAHVVDELEDYFSDTQWTCTSSGGAHCPASGIGYLDTLVDLPIGSSVLIDINAVLAPFPEDPVSNVAAVSVPASITDPDLANNVTSDGPDIRGVFRDEFE